MGVILLQGGHKYVSATHAAIFKVVRQDYKCNYVKCI